MSQKFTIGLWSENLDRGCRECDRALARGFRPHLKQQLPKFDNIHLLSARF
ncbi:hypothetical protein QUB00_10875 [Microcoleus sp. F8_C2]